MEDTEIKRYIKGLQSQLKKGMITQEEFDESLICLGIKRENELPRIAIGDSTHEEAIKIEQFHNLFYRELFGRPKNEDDEEIDNASIIIARTDEDKNMIGLAEFVLEPAEVYRGCVYLDKIVIDHRFRDNGLGSLLVYEIVRRTYEPGKIEQMVLYAPDSICGFYARNGFFLAHGIERKEGIDLRKMVLPFTKQAYLDLLDELEEPECERCIEYRRRLNDKTKHMDEEEKFEENTFLELLRKNLPPKEKYQLEL